MNILQNPTNKLLNQYLEQFNNDERYFPADEAISNLFKTFPANKKLEDVLLKISVINDLYSTNILGTFKMAKHIQKLDIDAEIRIGNPEIVNKIALGYGICNKKKNREINFYSFATKYCNWHNQEQYAIYDSFVEKVLIAYRNRDKFSNFQRLKLKEFSKFKEIISDFAAYYKISDFNLKEIDKFLRIYGK